ncbi:unnamed protein product [Pleuronectes platessa]|uniref:Uncharacterized protein n=1 Tax=Pleuronectes platessa TaxID=8262 RepID=A0A9N7UDT0_PLEPL|nr:unnamed protein product [Pleuronectes platessa]
MVYCAGAAATGLRSSVTCEDQHHLPLNQRGEMRSLGHRDEPAPRHYAAMGGTRTPQQNDRLEVGSHQIPCSESSQSSNPGRKQNLSRWVSEYGHGELTGICRSARRRWMHKKRKTNLNNNNLTTVPHSSMCEPRTLRS